VELSINTCMKKQSNKRVAKQLIKRAKKHPELYSAQDVMYAKLMRKFIKQNETETKEE